MEASDNVEGGGGRGDHPYLMSKQQPGNGQNKENKDCRIISVVRRITVIRRIRMIRENKKE